jgi:Permease for cytosine/purines, uracil, thiamine, allantoin
MRSLSELPFKSVHNRHMAILLQNEEHIAREYWHHDSRIRRLCRILVHLPSPPLDTPRKVSSTVPNHGRLYRNRNDLHVSVVCSSSACAAHQFYVVIWSLSVAKGVGPIFRTGQHTGSTGWSLSWVMMSSINSSIGSQAAGMTNGSDWSRYGKNKTGFLAGTFLCLFMTGTLVCLIGLVTTAACQQIYGEVYWNPPDLLMVMMDYGNGSSKSRAAVFFLALGFGLTVGVNFVSGLYSIFNIRYSPCSRTSWATLQQVIKFLRTLFVVDTIIRWD